MIGERIRALREQKGLTQGQLAEIIGNDGNTISIWLTGHDEYRAMIESLEFAANILREAEKIAETEK